MPAPKHHLVRDFVYQSIVEKKYPPGSQLPTDEEFCSQFKVSRPTIARAMLDLQRQGLIERTPGSGTFVTDKLNNSRTKQLGFLIPELGNTEIFEPICNEIARRSLDFGYSLLWGDSAASDEQDTFGRLRVSPSRADKACQHIIAQKISGVFYVPIYSKLEDHKNVDLMILQKLKEAGIAVVLLDRDLQVFPHRSHYDLVSVDHYAGQLMVCEHVLKTGRKKMIYLQWPGKTDSLEKRIAGYQTAMVRANLPVNDSMIYRGEPRNLDFISQILTKHNPDAFACENDVIAAHLMQTLNKLNRKVPEDIAIVGFDDVKTAALLNIPLTSMKQPCSSIGQVALDTMISRLNTPRLPSRTILISPELMIRESCGAKADLK